MQQVKTYRPALADPINVPHRISYKVLTPIRTLRRDMGLTPSDITVLTALISFLPREDTASTGRTSPISVVFPSNAALSERANGLDERSLRRCIARLSNSGLIHCRRSANGKRFPLRYGGKIRDAFGFDLAPLAERQAELVRQAAALTEEQERLRSLRAEALALRQEALQNQLDAPALTRLTAARNILRRATLKISDVLNLIEDLRQMIGSQEQLQDFKIMTTEPRTDEENPSQHAQTRAAETEELSARNGQNVRHIESSKIDIKKEKPSTKETSTTHTERRAMTRNTDSMDWQDFSGVASFYPKPPTSLEALKRIIFEIGNFLNVEKNKLTNHLRRAGPSRLLLALDCLISISETVRHPGAYLDRMLEMDTAHVMS